MLSVLLLSALIGGAGTDCAKPRTQAHMNDCALANFNRADAQMNAQWKLTYGLFKDESPESAARLRAAQRAWIAYRDAQCDAEHWFELGVSLDKFLNISCRIGLTEERTRQLKRMAKYQAG